jgi:RNA polymerase sigma-70 factor (ECF subfamily)
MMKLIDTRQPAPATCARIAAHSQKRHQAQEHSSVSETTALAVESMDDRQLMALVTDQPALAVAALYERYSKYVFSVALRMVGDRNVAEEVTQDVFLGCWRNATAYKPDRGSVATWLLTITHRRAIDELRSRRHKYRQSEMNWEQAPQNALASDQAMDVALTQSEVREALAGLPPNQREAVEMLYFGGFSRAEIAERLSTPLGTINTRLRLAMDKLRAMLVPGYGDQ